MRRAARVARSLACCLLLSCTSTVPPSVTVFPREAFTAEPTLFVSAARQRASIVRSLEDAGFTVLDLMSEANYRLDAKVGSKRKSSACGTLNNVSFALWGEGAPVMVLKARGWTGSCPQNVFDGMSRLMGSYF